MDVKNKVILIIIFKIIIYFKIYIFKNRLLNDSIEAPNLGAST